MLAKVNAFFHDVLTAGGVCVCVFERLGVRILHVPPPAVVEARQHFIVGKLAATELTLLFRAKEGGHILKESTGLRHVLTSHLHARHFIPVLRSTDGECETADCLTSMASFLPLSLPPFALVRHAAPPEPGWVSSGG